MRINEGNVTNSSIETGRAAESQRADRGNQSRAAGTGTPGSDRVELSNALGSLSRVLSSFGSQRAGRVQELAAQYQSGRYEPNIPSSGRGLIADALAAHTEA